MSLSSTPVFWSKGAVKLMINSVDPTALQTMSNDSGKVFVSTFSILLFMTLVFSKPKREVVCNKNDDFLVLLSIK